MSAYDLIKKTKKILTEPQYKFLKQLGYWSLSQKDYGVKLNGKTWIYNTHQQWAEQIGYGVTTVRESIAFLEQLGFISSDFLNPNKRRRVKYYSINFAVIENHFEKLASKKQKTSEKNQTESSAISTVSESSEQQLNRQMERQMYTKNKIQENKSYKSQTASAGDNFCYTDPMVCQINKNDYFDTEGKNSAKDSRTVVSENVKNIGCRSILPCQDMIKILKQELFANQEIRLNKQLARYLVASFKLKFENSLEKWRHYLRLIKTSTYLMGEKFKLSVWWIIKFATIDRIRAGELGVDESKIPVNVSEIEQKAQQHADSVNESKICKQFRHEIIRKLSPAVYLSWFTKVDLAEGEKQMVIKTANKFVRDYINANFLEKIVKLSSRLYENPRKIFA